MAAPKWVWLKMGCPVCGNDQNESQWYHSSDKGKMKIDTEGDVFHDKYVHSKAFSGMYSLFLIVCVDFKLMKILHFFELFFCLHFNGHTQYQNGNLIVVNTKLTMQMQNIHMQNLVK